MLTPKQDRRIRVSTPTRARAARGEVPVTIVALSARRALLHAQSEIAARGECIELFLPTIGGAEIEVLAGIDHVEPVREGFAISTEFVVVDDSVRRQLNELMALLLAGDGGGRRKHPRVVYDVMIRYRDSADRMGRLEELSIGGALLRVYHACAKDDPITLHIPHPATQMTLRVGARVVNVHHRSDGAFGLGLAFDCDEATTHAIARILAELMGR